jgi:hypothetical protein
MLQSANILQTPFKQLPNLFAQSYIKYELIVSFQFYIKSFIHVSSQKNLDEVFHSNKCKWVSILLCLNNCICKFSLKTFS